MAGRRKKAYDSCWRAAAAGQAARPPARPSRTPPPHLHAHVLAQLLGHLASLQRQLARGHQQQGCRAGAGGRAGAGHADRRLRAAAPATLRCARHQRRSPWISFLLVSTFSRTGMQKAAVLPAARGGDGSGSGQGDIAGRLPASAAMVWARQRRARAARPPVPFLARARISRPVSAMGMDSSWMGLGASKPFS